MAEKKTIADPMQETVTVYLPRMPGEEPTVFVGLNGKRYLIPRGKHEQVPKPVADLIEECQRSRERADRYTQEKEEEFLRGPVY